MILAMYQPCRRCAAPLEWWNKIERKEVMPPNKVVDPLDEDKEVEEGDEEVPGCEDAGDFLDVSEIEM